MKRSKLGILVLFLLISTGYWGLSNDAFSWPVENGVPICLGSLTGNDSKLISDEQGGFIITYRFDNPTLGTTIVVKAHDSTGSYKWGQWFLGGESQLIGDGHGGVLVVWEHYLNSKNTTDIYAQAIDNNGESKWVSYYGISINSASNIQARPQLVSDGNGGAIIAWMDYRSGNGNPDIYAQAVDSSGMLKWDIDGVAICTAYSIQTSLQLVSDGNGGAIITWMDYRSGNNNPDIYAQAIDSSGSCKWVLNGVTICTASSEQLYPKIVSDDEGGAVITWEDGRNGGIVSASIYDIYAQAIDRTGEVKWALNGIPICIYYGNKYEPQIISDGQGGAIITWTDYRNFEGYGAFQFHYAGIYAQYVNNSGILKWDATGQSISSIHGVNDKKYPQIVSDGQGGAIITWQDHRNGNNYDIYAQFINNGGGVQWMNEVTICTASYDQLFPQIVSDGHGGAIIAWEDYRNGNCDIYAQSISSEGIVPVELSKFYYEP